MTKAAQLTLLLTVAFLWAPRIPALALSTEDPSTASGDGSSVTDPEDQIDQFINPSAGPQGDATIETPEIQMPPDDLDDYLPPDSDDVPDDTTTGPGG